MSSTFYIHLISTLINITFLLMNWWYCRKIININYELRKEFIDQERQITRCLAKIACLEIDVTSLKFDKKDK